MPEKASDGCCAPDAKPDRPSAGTVTDDERLRTWHTLMTLIGCRYRDARLSNFEHYHPAQEQVTDALLAYAEQLPQRVKLGQSIVLYGTVGTGKDHLLAAMIRAACINGLRPAWVNGLDLYGDIRDRMDQEGSRESTLVRSLAAPDILCVSDPLPPKGGGVTEFQATMLYRIIDRRYRDSRPTWITMNVLDGSEAEQRLGAAIVDRLRDNGGLCLPCCWPSYRKRTDRK